MPHSEQKCAHFCSEWGIVGYGTGAFWDLCIRSSAWCYPYPSGLLNCCNYPSASEANLKNMDNHRHSLKPDYISTTKQSTTNLCIYCGVYLMNTCTTHDTVTKSQVQYLMQRTHLPNFKYNIWCKDTFAKFQVLYLMQRLLLKIQFSLTLLYQAYHYNMFFITGWLPRH